MVFIIFLGSGSYSGSTPNDSQTRTRCINLLQCVSECHLLKYIVPQCSSISLEMRSSDILNWSTNKTVSLCMWNILCFSSRGSATSCCHGHAWAHVPPRATWSHSPPHCPWWPSWEYPRSFSIKSSTEQRHGDAAANEEEYEPLFTCAGNR